MSRYSNILDEPERWLTDQQRRWLLPRSVFTRFAYTVLFLFNWIVLRLLFRVTVEGRENLRASGPLILAPNHSSPLDPPILAAALPLSLLQQTFWAAKESTVLRNRRRRFLSWLTRVIPISDEATALAAAVTVLDREHNLVWFPEGKRSLDGKLQALKPGVGIILARCDVPVVPIFIDGAHAAFPSRAKWPKLRTRIVVRIGSPQSARQLGLEPPDDRNLNLAVERLRDRLVELRDA